MKCGEIWFVEFGDLTENNYQTTGHEYKKPRPALIVESDKQLKITAVITIIPFTSKNQKQADDIFIFKDTLNNLNYDSVLKVHHIQSFDSERFIKKIG